MKHFTFITLICTACLFVMGTAAFLLLICDYEGNDLAPLLIVKSLGIVLAWLTWRLGLRWQGRGLLSAAQKSLNR
jgi:hypothetical protein